jgi:hypothetical protein
MVFMSPAPFERLGGVRLVHVQTEGHAPRIGEPVAAAERVVAGALDVAEEPVEAQVPVEADARGELHRRLDGPDRRSAGHRRPADHHLVGRLDPRAGARRRVDHLAQAHPCGGQLVVHAAGQLPGGRVVASSRRRAELEGSGSFGDADVDVKGAQTRVHAAA